MPKTSSIVAALSDARCVLLKAKFHYADPTGPDRTRTDFVGDPHGPTEFLGDTGPVGSVRVRVVEFSYK